MEFPPEKLTSSRLRERVWRVTPSCTLQVMLQMRPKGRCLDHYRIALDGMMLETQVIATNVFCAPVLAKY
jgi:hypothetical protein